MYECSPVLCSSLVFQGRYVAFIKPIFLEKVSNSAESLIMAELICEIGWMFESQGYLGITETSQLAWMRTTGDGRT